MISFTNTNNNRVFPMDILRVIACLMVIILHVVADGIYEDWTSDSTVLVVWDTFSQGAVLIFFMLSGAFSTGTSIKKSLKKSAYYFILFVVFKLLFTFWDTYWYDNGISVSGLLDKGITDLTISKYHLWFLPEFIVVTLLAPLINVAVKQIKNADIYLSVLFIIFDIAMENTFIIGSSGYELNITKWFLGVLPMHFTSGIGYFCIGKSIYNHIIENKDKIKKPGIYLMFTGILWFIVKIVMCLATIAKSSAIGAFEYSMFDSQGLLTLAASVFFFSFFSLITAIAPTVTWNRNGCKALIYKAIETIVPCTLCVYLIHPFFVDYLTIIGFKPLAFNPIISVPLKTILVFLISFAVSAVLLVIKGKIRPHKNIS